MECYTAALTALPGEPRALGNRAACYAALGRYGESLSDADAAAAAEPLYAKAHSRRGLALWHMNRYHEAAEAYQKAMQLDASSADAKEVRRDCCVLPLELQRCHSLAECTWYSNC